MASSNNVIHTPHSRQSPDLLSLPGTLLGIRILEARLKINVASFREMRPFIVVRYNDQEWKSKTASRKGMNPKWPNAYHRFALGQTNSINVELMDKSVIFQDTEIGRRWIPLDDIVQGHTTEWWELLNRKNQITGSILLTFEFFAEGERKKTDHSLMALISTHSSNNSIEIVQEYDKKMMELESKLQYLTQMKNNLINDKRVHTEESIDQLSSIDCDLMGINEIEQIRSDLTDENDKIKRREQQVKRTFEKLKLDQNKIESETIEIRKRKEAIHRREESVQIEKRNLKKEREAMKKEREKFQFIKTQIKFDTQKIRNERARLQQEQQLLNDKRIYMKELALDLHRQSMLLKHRGVVEEEDSKARASSEWQEIFQFKRTLADKQRILQERIQSFEQVRERRASASTSN